MKFDSPHFDRIRVKPDEDRRLRASCPSCDWPGCGEAATHRAPKGRLRENEYWRFCLAHVRDYNQSYNYFAGMSDDAVAQFQKESIIGHRPTWKIGMNGPINGKARRGSTGVDAGFSNTSDPFDVFGELGGRARQDFEARHPEGRVLRNAERKALETLGLERNATAHEVKMRFKTLVKRHHPDANGGDRSTEDKLREIIQAYNYLKSVKFV
ncbi:MAG: DnaJ domain-containing protein [Rhizobiales bacterium]|nr:DnaJ domain-containing protein [Hyphomicrobiales bacterium]